MNCPLRRYRCPTTRPDTSWLTVGSVAPPASLRMKYPPGFPPEANQPPAPSTFEIVHAVAFVSKSPLTTRGGVLLSSRWNVEGVTVDGLTALLNVTRTVAS